MIRWEQYDLSWNLFYGIWPHILSWLWYAIFDLKDDDNSIDNEQEISIYY